MYEGWGEVMFITQDPVRDGINWYWYCGNNPLTNVDSNGLEQNAIQKIMTYGLKYTAEHSNIAKGFIKNHTKIDINRSSNDKDDNYYQSTSKIKFLGIPLNSVPVQSTADHPDPSPSDGTLPEGDYNGRLLTTSGSYLNAIEIQSPDFLIHPDEITNPEKKEERIAKGKSNGPFSQPFSLGCQIMHLSDFNETIDILHDIGFESNNSDTIKVTIKKEEE